MLTRAAFAALVFALVGCSKDPPAQPTSAKDAGRDAGAPAPDAEPDAAPIRIVALEPRVEITIPDLPDAAVEPAKPEPKAKAKAKRGKRRKARKKARRRATPLSTIRSNMRDIEECYGAVALKDPSIKGRIVVQWTLGRDGVPTGTAILSDSLSDKSVGACIKRRARRWKFPPPQGGVSVVKYPFDLKVQ